VRKLFGRLLKKKAKKCFAMIVENEMVVLKKKKGPPQYDVIYLLEWFW